MNFQAANDAERQRLFALTKRLDADSLSRKLPNGWSVADALVHLAFWDFYAVKTLEEWRQTGFRLLPDPYDLVNGALLPLSTALPPSAVIDLVHQAAIEADQAAAEVSCELAAVIVAGGCAKYLDRAEHRRHHLDQIDALPEDRCCA